MGLTGSTLSYRMATSPLEGGGGVVDVVETMMGESGPREKVKFMN